MTVALLVLVVTILAPVSTASLEAFATCLCTVFLAAAALRLLKVAFAGKARRRPLRRGDDRLPIYTIICALYREANVVNRLVAAIPVLWRRRRFNNLSTCPDVL